MKYYDFQKAKLLIQQSADCLESASLGMHEDWFWTACTIWENNMYKIELQENALDKEKKLQQARKDGMSIFDKSKDENGLSKINPVFEEMSNHQIAGLMGSGWATPTLQLIYKDGEDKMIPCFVFEGEEVSLGEKIERQIWLTSGCLSSEVQENITPLTLEQP